MEGFFNALKSSGLADAVKDMAMEALHLNDDKKEENATNSRPRRHEESSDSSWGPTPQEAESGDVQPEWRRQSRPSRRDDDEYSEQRPARPARYNEDDESSQPEWRRPRPERDDERPSGGNWAQVVGDEDEYRGNSNGWSKPAAGRKHQTSQ